jgi:uncharacterized membrane protein
MPSPDELQPAPVADAAEDSAPDAPATEPSRAQNLRTSRMEAFSDGVFAIAITLLVLEIAVPVVAGADLLRGVEDEWPSYLAYFVSFSTIGAVWLMHSLITEFLDHADQVFLRLNLLLLLVVAFLPFPTSLVARSLGDPEHERVAATMYGVNFLLASVLLYVLWRYAVHQQLIRSDATKQDIAILNRRVTPSVGAYVILIAVGLQWPTAAVIGYLVIAAFLIFPARGGRPEQERGRPGGGRSRRDSS